MINPYLYNKYKRMTTKELNNALEAVCVSGDLNEVKYLLTSSDLKSHANPTIHSNSPLFMACREGHLHIVKYLLSSSELKKHADIYSDHNRCFKTICAFGRLDIAEYLIFEFGIEKNKEIDNILQIKKDSCSKAILNMFEVRELNNPLNEEKVNTKKMKP